MIAPIRTPAARLASPDDEAAARKRREVREMLLRGEKISVTQPGAVVNARQAPQASIVVPEGKLASLYWYDNDPELLSSETQAMSQFFPQFTLGKLSDGRLSWQGTLQTDLRTGGVWHLQAVYENNHPSNDSWGGSVKIYSILPDLEEVLDSLDEPIPHTLTDSAGHLYLCTARKEDVKVGDWVTSAASSLAWAAKWIAAFELWMAGDLSTDRFAAHI